MIVKSWEGAASPPDGEIRLDRHIPISLEFPLDTIGGSQFSCFYRSRGVEVSSSDGRVHTIHAMLEVVVEEDSGLLCRLVLVSVSRAIYKDYDPGPVVVGNPVFDVAASRGSSLRQRDREVKSLMVPSIDQWEPYEVWVGDHRLTILFRDRAMDTAIQIGGHLIMFVDKDREVCGFQFTSITEEQWERIIKTIKFPEKVIDPAYLEDGSWNPEIPTEIP